MMPRRRRAERCSAMDDRERLIGLIYEGVTNEEVWQELLTLLGDRVNAAAAGLGLQDMATHEFRAHGGCRLAARWRAAGDPRQRRSDSVARSRRRVGIAASAARRPASR